MDENEIYIDMLDFTKLLIEKFSKDEVIKIVENLKLWVNSGSEISVYRLKQIALGYRGEHEPITGDFDKAVKRDLIEYYGTAARTGIYATELLEAGLTANRGPELLSYLSEYKQVDKTEFDVTKYVSDKEWSDYWIRQLCDCAKKLKEHKDFGYDLMSVFTPKHDPSTFFEMCIYLRDEEKYRIPLDWLRDEHWRPSKATSVMQLYLYAPRFDWGIDIIRPWMSRFLIDEIFQNKNQAAIDCNAIIEKWKNVSPMLEYALVDYCEHDNLNYDLVYEKYDTLKRKHYCDGDDLAGWLYRGRYPAEVIKHNEYYHECVNNWSGITVDSSANKSNGRSKVSTMFNAAAIMGGD